MKCINRIWKASDVEWTEYRLLKIVTLWSKENEIIKERMKEWFETMIINQEYQKLAIEVVEDDEDFYSLRGTVTSKLLLIMAEKVNKDILDKLLYNILYSYQDEEEKIPLFFTGETFDCNYALTIICTPEIKLKKEYQERIAELLIEHAKSSEEFDVKLFTSFLLRKDVKREYKEKVIEALETEQLAAIDSEILMFYSECLFSSIMGIESFENEEPVATDGQKAEGNITEIVELIAQKLGKPYED